MNPIQRLIERKLAAHKRKTAQRDALRAVQAYPRIADKAAHGLSSPLIVSLTSYAKRFATLDLTIKSLLDQDIVIDQLLLWVSPEDLKHLPASVRALEGAIFRAMPTKDIRSYTKLIPALRSHPECFILTADDDIHYPSDWARSIVEGYEVGVRMTVCRRAHMAAVGPDGSTLPYHQWPHAVDDVSDRGRNFALFPTGVGGVLYPPNTFDSEVLREDIFLELCPYADDLWFFWLQMVGQVQRLRSGTNHKFIAWPSSQESALMTQNYHLGRNDLQVCALESRYGRLKDILKA